MEDFKDDPFFADAEFCALVDNPAYLLGVRNQGATYVCYAFVVVSCIYADMCKSTGGAGKEGSVQEFLDCLHIDYPPKSIEVIEHPPPKEGYPNNFKNAFRYVIDKGLLLDADYPWSGLCGSCLRNKKNYDLKISVECFERIRINKVIENLRNHYTVAASVFLTRTLYHWTGTEVYTMSNQGEKEDGEKEEPLGRHAITLIGYGVEDGVEYFMAQNSYGVEWGYKGYVKIARKCVSNFYVVHGSCLKEKGASYTEQKEDGDLKRKDGKNRELMGSFMMKKAKHV